MTKAVVVGSGPNGLAAAVALAQQGIAVTVLEAQHRIGGGTRSSELTVPGVLHDECSGIHPVAVGSPFLSTLGLDRYGLTWRWPEIDAAHPLDDGSAGVLYRSVEQTAAGLGVDGRVWRALFGASVRGADELLPSFLGPVLKIPRHPIRLARFGLAGLPPATVTARLFRTAAGRALFAGNIAHSFYRLDRPMTPVIGMGIVVAGHRHGWAVAKGGSRAITDALAALLTELGGTIETGVRVRSLAELAASHPAEITMLDVAPGAVAELAGDRLPPRVRRAYLRYRHGPAAFKVDYAVSGGVPWTNEAVRKAGTVHLGGTFEQVAAAEADCARGRLPARPFVLVGQQHLADPGRSAGDVHPLYAYAHVPNGYAGPAGQLTELVTTQIERFAPGFRDRIVASVSTSLAAFEAHNANNVGGDIIGGLSNARQIVLRPRPALDPYRTGIPGVYLCSQSTPPGAGAHGMCGYHAAQSALRALRRGPSATG
ncbi:MAG TPA: NAD(P)/FAD-dependent oxidoreductase [Pseudonocardia sp.]|jgi:phytoene dehydrogenase-like protein|uniref:phytoene desaturase family protein n=1 Tax=Pseudonocardia sp. TaxID=60912 RepID=UPI002F4301F1